MQIVVNNFAADLTPTEPSLPFLDYGSWDESTEAKESAFGDYQTWRYEMDDAEAGTSGKPVRMVFLNRPALPDGTIRTPFDIGRFWRIGTLRGRRDAALIGLLLGCGLRRSEAVNLRFDQLQLRESHWVIVDIVGKGGRLRTVPVPPWCKGLIDGWFRDSRVTEGKIFRRVSKNGARQDARVTSDVVWYAVKQYARRIGVDGLAPHDLRRTCARLCHGAGEELE
jgi:integrase